MTHIDSSRFRRPACRSVSLILLLGALGCGSPPPFEEVSGREVVARLPESVRPVVDPEPILCFEEKGEGGAYTLQILRKPGGTWIRDPDKKPPGWEQHRMPATALEGLIAAKVPSLKRGTPEEPRCRLTHWRDPDGAEIQIRELVTDQGWFASVERVLP